MGPAAETAARLTGHLESVIVEIVETADLNTSTWSGTGGVGGIATKHCHTRSKLGATQGDHMLPIETYLSVSTGRRCEEGKQMGPDLPDVTGDQITLMRSSVH